MSDSTSKTEYIVTYHTKSGGKCIETYDDYGVALFQQQRWKLIENS